MEHSIKSRAFFVGNLPHKVKYEKITNTFGSPVIENAEDYDFLCSYFHKSHVDAMIEAESQKRPKFLNAVHHFYLDINKSLPISFFDSKTGRLDVLEEYKMTLKGLHVYCFPLDITLLALEIDDSGSSLDDLTLAHARIRELPSKWEEFPVVFTDALKPIKDLVPNGNVKDLVTRGNKLKIFQIVLVESSDWTEEHLYEIATCSPINIVGTSHIQAPSDEYFNSMIENNTMAPFKDWKSMSLRDSFTALFKEERSFDEIKWINSYYRLIYLRVLVQKTFLSSKNVQYRLNQSSSHLMRDLTRMEQYYFYDNISYNFLPDLLNIHMEEGLGINNEGAELSAQIKESESKNNNTLTGIVSAFAVFSIAYDFYGILKAITSSESPIMPFVIGLIASLSILYIIVHLSRRR